MKFITIKCNADKLSIGKCYDYLRRFSERIWLVTSPKGGTHYHALVVLKDKKKVSFLKGLHIKVEEVKDRTAQSVSYDPEAKQCRLDDAQEAWLLAFQTDQSKDAADEAAEKVMAPPSKEYQRKVSKRSKTRKETRIHFIIQYLIKNLSENTGTICMYQHYIILSKQ